jgi:predicted kinase/predicted enzyme related to lactoylglutathione lyase
VHLEHVAIIVDDYDDAIAFFVGDLGFELVEDSLSRTNDGRPKRWVVVRPPGARTGLLLARADGATQTAAVGAQFAGRVGLFVRVDDFEATHERMLRRGVEFLTAPKDEAFGRFAVFEDIAGNKWDLLGPLPDSPVHPVGRLVVITGLPGSGKTTLAIELATRIRAVRMCPDESMRALGIDLWDAVMRARIEALQGEQALQLLRFGTNVIIEWGVWTRSERDVLRDQARSLGARVELRYQTAPPEELWRRIVERDREGAWGSRSIRRDELDEWVELYEPPTDEELAAYDQPTEGSSRPS